MAYKCSFLDSQTYSAQDVNDIFARITQGGVVFTDTGYTFGDLNAAQEATVTGGVTRDTNSCMVVKDGDTYKISKGACFMNDGSAIIFDEDGQEIEITPDVINYVYLVRNLVANSIDIVVSEAQGDADSIPLAEIDEDGNVFDRRKYARAKVDLATSGNVKNFTVTIPKVSASSTQVVTTDLEDGAFSYIILWGGKRVFGDDVEGRIANRKNLVPIDEGEEVRIAIGEYESGEDELLYCIKDEKKVHVYLSKATVGAEYTFDMGVL